jgi:hypothetical protein
VHELEHRWASPVMAVRVHVHRKSNYVLQYIYLPLFLMTFVSLNTILVGYGMELVSAFGDRCSITLTLLLTVRYSRYSGRYSRERDGEREIKNTFSLIKLDNFSFLFYLSFFDIHACTYIYL